MSQQPQPQTLGKLIDAMLELRDQRSALAKQDKELKKQYDELEGEIMRRLEAEDTIQGKSKTATATISSVTIPTIEDWDAFAEYVYNNNALYMIEKRPSSAAFRELLAQGEEVPGLKPFIKQSISLRRL